MLYHSALWFSYWYHLYLQGVQCFLLSRPDVPRRAPIGHEKPLILLQFLLQLSEGHIEKSKTGVPYRITDGRVYKDASPDARAFPVERCDLRRTKATGVRSILGKEAAKVLLGHT